MVSQSFDKSNRYNRTFPHPRARLEPFVSSHHDHTDNEDEVFVEDESSDQFLPLLVVARLLDALCRQVKSSTIVFLQFLCQSLAILTTTTPPRNDDCWLVDASARSKLLERCEAYDDDDGNALDEHEDYDEDCSREPPPVPSTSSAPRVISGSSAASCSSSSSWRGAFFDAFSLSAPTTTTTTTSAPIMTAATASTTTSPGSVRNVSFYSDDGYDSGTDAKSMDVDSPKGSNSSPSASGCEPVPLRDVPSYAVGPNNEVSAEDWYYLSKSLL